VTITEFLSARLAHDQDYLDNWAETDRADTNRLEAEIQAKRRLLEWALIPRDDLNDGPEIEVIQILASVYADHPDFDPAWRD